MQPTRYYRVRIPGKTKTKTKTKTFCVWCFFFLKRERATTPFFILLHCCVLYTCVPDYQVARLYRLPGIDASTHTVLVFIKCCYVRYVNVWYVIISYYSSMVWYSYSTWGKMIDILICVLHALPGTPGI